MISIFNKHTSSIGSIALIFFFYYTESRAKWTTYQSFPSVSAFKINKIITVYFGFNVFTKFVTEQLFEKELLLLIGIVQCYIYKIG